MVYGREETWKSMLVGLDMAFKIATGQPWFGYKTIASPVYVFQTEIPQAPLRKRVIKYMSGNKVTSNQIWYSSELYMKLDKGWGYAELEKEIIRTQPKVLIISFSSSAWPQPLSSFMYSSELYQIWLLVVLLPVMYLIIRFLNGDCGISVWNT